MVESCRRPTHLLTLPLLLYCPDDSSASYSGWISYYAFGGTPLLPQTGESHGHSNPQGALAIQLLERRVDERTRELRGLLELSRTVASTLELPPLLQVVAEQFRQVIHCDDATIYMLEKESLRVMHFSGPMPLPDYLKQLLPLDRMPPHRPVIRGRKPVVVGDLRGSDPLAVGMQREWGLTLDRDFAFLVAWMGIPLIVQDRVIRMIGIGSRTANSFTPEHMDLAQAIASHAAAAMENARLCAEAQRAAALEERQRLARELHDSVSQVLYGIQLGAQTARELVATQPEENSRLAESLSEPLDYVLSLAEAGLAEMRALIFELRPESLQTEGLVAGLTKLMAFVRVRNHLAVVSDLCDEPQVPIELKETLYRIVQEALQNIVKHAQATAATVTLRCGLEGVEVVVVDDGRGFDPRGVFPGHLGLRSMQERAARTGGKVIVTSRLGEGTRVQAWLPRRKE